MLIRVVFMTIKSHKENRFVIICLFICTILCFFPLAAISNFQNLTIPVITEILVLFIVFREWIAVDRTFILNEEGITVKFLFYSKEYKWSALKVKSIVNCEKSKGAVEPYKSCAIFSPKSHQKPKWLLPSMYGRLFHPISFIFIYFDPPFRYNRWKVHRDTYTYEIEENEFMQKMIEWNVCIIDER